AYVANENKTFHGQEPAANTRGYDAGLKYANGPIMAAVTYNAVSLGNAAKTDISDFRVGASYDFGMASIRGIFDRARADHFGGAGYTQNVFGLGGTFNVTPAGKIIGQFYFADEMKRNGKDQKDTGAKLFEIGYEHSLSKRTILKAVYAHLNNDANAGYDFGINAAGVNSVTNAGPTFSTVGATVQGVQLGLRHSF
ncbi:MAG: porin, partial [Zoogloea sp.]|nr:porin [Zoogloea sp.]